MTLPIFIYFGDLWQEVYSFARVAKIVGAFMDELDEGKKPTIAEYLFRYPELSEKLKPLLKIALALETHSFDDLEDDLEEAETGIESMPYGIGIIGGFN